MAKPNFTVTIFILTVIIYVIATIAKLTNKPLQKSAIIVNKRDPGYLEITL